MSDDDLRGPLLDMASGLRQRADNLISAGWSEAYKDMPVLRQNQYGMALEAAVTADELIGLLGIDPRSMWPRFKLPEPLPDEERAKLVWTDGVDR